MKKEDFTFLFYKCTAVSGSTAVERKTVIPPEIISSARTPLSNCNTIHMSHLVYRRLLEIFFFCSVLM